MQTVSCRGKSWGYPLPRCVFFPLVLVVAGEGLVGGESVDGPDVNEGGGVDGPGVDEGGGVRAGLGTSAAGGRLQFL